MLTHTFRGCTLRSALGLEDERKAFERYKAIRNEGAGVRVTSVSSRVYPLVAQVMPATMSLRTVLRQRRPRMDG